MQILSNGRLKSSMHRAVVDSTRDRISVAAFGLPGSPDVIIGPLPQFVDEKHPASYTTMAYCLYSSLYFNRNMHDKPETVLGSNETVV
jgi:isopenicillin N synthase-like dioxygenase